MKRQLRHTLLLLPLVAAALLMAACASMGRPEGGPRDTYPPVFVRSNPVPGTLRVAGNKITIEFDENIQLDDPMNKVVVSPAQQVNPQISSNGRRITIELRDTLLPNTTYTIDFADAIKDLNEGNVLDGFAIDFSTGDVLDSLRISGMVFEAATLEPAQGMIVGAYLDRGDTAITTTRFDRITKTNQLGQFTLRNLKPGSYRVYALNDMNRDFHWDRTEDIAFLDSTVTPWATQVMVTDTIASSTGADSIFSHQATRYYPNDLILCWFNENYLTQYLKEYKRPDERRLTFVLGAPTDSLPSFRLLNGQRAGLGIDDWATLNVNARGDSLEYWITDTTVLRQDTLRLQATYQRVDTLDRLVWKTDTLAINFRRPKPKKKDSEEETDSVPAMEFLKLTSSPSGSLDLNVPIIFKSPTPIARVDSGCLTLETLVDSVWTAVVPAPQLERVDSLDPMNYKIQMAWTPETKYRLSIDSAAIADIYGLHNSRIVQEFTSKSTADYSALFFNISGPQASQPVVVELLTSGDKVAARAPVVGSTAELLYLAPGTYYARLFIDANGNGVWDTGNLAASLQPEEVYYYPRAINLKKNWDVEQSWDIYETPLDRQKLDAIKKNKPPRRPGDPLPDNKQGSDDADDMYGDEFDNFNTQPYQNPFEQTHRGRR